MAAEYCFMLLSFISVEKESEKRVEPGFETQKGETFGGVDAEG
jgi:hypothetical protein